MDKTSVTATPAIPSIPPWGRVSPSVCADRDLNAGDLRVMIAMCTYADFVTGEVSGSMKTIGQRAGGMDRRNVVNHIANLERRGHLRRIGWRATPKGKVGVYQVCHGDGVVIQPDDKGLSSNQMTRGEVVIQPDARVVIQPDAQDIPEYIPRKGTETPPSPSFSDSPEAEGKQAADNGQVLPMDLPNTPKPAKEQRAKPRSQITDDWVPDGAGIAYAVSKQAPYDNSAVDAFRNYHQHKGTLSASWPASWRTWCDNAERFRRTSAPVSDRMKAFNLLRVLPGGGSHRHATEAEPLFTPRNITRSGGSVASRMVDAIRADLEVTL